MVLFYGVVCSDGTRALGQLHVHMWHGSPRRVRPVVMSCSALYMRMPHHKHPTQSTMKSALIPPLLFA